MPKASLRSAQLDFANLQQSDLSLADLSDASLLTTNLAAANLSEAKGLKPEQLVEACINTRTTRLPPNVLPASYSVPPECCRLWSEKTNGFATSEGKCVAK
jgi:hypothetical protein